jgi:hypothetical protein
MFDRSSFVNCIAEQLTQKRFGDQKRKEIVDQYNRIADTFERQGYTGASAANAAMQRVFEVIDEGKKEKARGIAKAIEVHADTISQVEKAAGIAVGLKSFLSLMIGGKRQNSTGTALARAAFNMIEADPRLGGSSFVALRDVTRAKLAAQLAAGFDEFGKGAFGTRRGTVANDADIVREIHGELTGNKAAKVVADAIKATTSLAHREFIAAGGKIYKLDEFNLPQNWNAVKLLEAGYDEYSRFMGQAIDWEKTRWPDGTMIPEAERANVLEVAFQTKTTDGASDIDLSKLREYGSPVGDLTSQGRFFVFKDAKSWTEYHQRFGDGNLLDVMSGYIDTMAHKIALVEKFGRSPRAALDNAKRVIMKKAAEAQKAGEKTATNDADMALRSFAALEDNVLRQNTMNPNSFAGSTVQMTGNLLTSAYLGSTAFISASSDLLNTATVRLARGGPMSASMSTYLKLLANSASGEQDRLLAQAGFVTDSVLSTNYATQRFGIVQTHGPRLGRTLSDFTMRASGLNAHTNAARTAPKLEMAAHLAANFNKKFDELPMRDIMRKYGIEESEWDAVRQKVTPDSDLKSGTLFLTPTAIDKSTLGNKRKIYNKFATMYTQEAAYMVPNVNLEAQAFLRGNTRPDSLPGLLLASATMFKQMPVTIFQNNGRLAMAMPDARSRLGFVAAVGLSTLGAGLLALQMNELAKGRTPMPMDDPRTWGKAFLSGGALGIWGDYLFSPQNEYGGGLAASAAGPILGFYGEALNLVLSEPYAFVESMAKGEEYTPKLGKTLVDFARYNTPGTSIWWSRLALERYVWDNLETMLDPNAATRQRQKVSRRQREFGNDYWWRPGEDTPDF